jgi:MtN3 and saliva related transmembrane protein
MHFDAYEILGLIAGALTAFATLPQSVRIIRTRDAGAVSALTYAMLLGSYVLWLAYGALKGLPSIVVWNVVGVALAALVLILKCVVWRR